MIHAQRILILVALTAVSVGTGQKAEGQFRWIIIGDEGKRTGIEGPMVNNEIPLSDAVAGNYCCIRIDATGDDSIRMKRLGICEDRSLEIVKRGDPMIVKVCGAQIGMSCQLASLVTVRQLGPDNLCGAE